MASGTGPEASTAGAPGAPSGARPGAASSAHHHAPLAKTPLLSRPPVAIGVSTADFVLRLAYFSVAPIVLYAVGLVLPIAGIVVNVSIAIVAYFLATRIRKVPTLAKVLRRALRFEEYYRENPPKPFLYYVFFPLLFPYWIAKRSARRELLAYRAFTGLSFVVLVGIAVYRYVTLYRPELTIADAAGFTLACIALEFVVTMLFLMPLATTVVTYHAARRRKRLAVLIAALLLATGAAIWTGIAHPPLVRPIEVQWRVRTRTAIAGGRAQAVLFDAATDALDEIPVEGDKIPNAYHDIWIEGEAADAARAKLAALYKPDECDAFRLSVVHTKGGHEALLLFLARSGALAPRVWIAVDENGKKLRDDSIADRELVNAQLGVRPRVVPKADERRKTRRKKKPAPGSP